MIEMQPEQLPDRVTVSAMQEKVSHATYDLMPDGRTTLCQITLQNGFTVLGTSSCVSRETYNQALGEKYAYEKAFEQIWELEGYLLRQRRFEAGLK